MITDLSSGKRGVNVFGSDACERRHVLDAVSYRSIIAYTVWFGAAQFDAWEFSRFFPAFYGTGTGMSDGNNF